MTDKIQISEAVMERVNNELVRAILDTPDYVKKIVEELMKEPGKYNSYAGNDDYNKPLFERVLRAELRTMIQQSLVAMLRDKYRPAVDDALRAALGQQEKVENTLAHALSRMLENDYKLMADVTLNFKKDD